MVIYGILKDHVDKFMNDRKDENWFYISRLKELESFALKVETGICSDPRKLEDFFACTLVVDNLESINKAEKLVRRRFVFHERRPPLDTRTTKPSDSFRFDDTRLYVKWKDRGLSRPTGLNGYLFEVQIKTYLAHAWGIATHDLTYKTGEKSWPKERIAYQIKAMLEHAEISIMEAEQLAQCTSLKKTDDISQRIGDIIKMVNDIWPSTALPRDTKRLAENIDQLLRSINMDIVQLLAIIKTETSLGRGTKTLNLSPYTTVVQSLLNQEQVKMVDYMTGTNRAFKIYLPKELVLPSGLDLSGLTNAIIGS